MFRAPRFLVSVALVGLAAAACSPGPATPGETEDKEDEAVHARPPVAGPANPTDGEADLVFAVSKFSFGDTTPDGTPDTVNGWKHYGYDIDGLISTVASTDLCKPRAGGTAKNVYPDGNDGIDNSFGRNLLPILQGLAINFSAKVNDALASEPALLIALGKLGTGADYNPLAYRSYVGAPLEDEAGEPRVATYDGTDVCPVTADSVSNADDVLSAKNHGTAGYVVGNTWVSGPPSTISATFKLSGMSMTLDFHHAVATMELSADHRRATNGRLSGVLETEQLQSEMVRILANFDGSFCDPGSPTVASILTQFEQASDIMKDGSQDPSKTCDGISFGVGFDADLVTLGAVAAPPAPAEDPCSEP